MTPTPPPSAPPGSVGAQKVLPAGVAAQKPAPREHCTFPSGSTSCKNPTCSGGTATTYACAGDGSCKAAQSDCGNYACGSTACRTSCADNSQCAADAWCQGDQCVPKIADGKGCGGDNQCESGQCVSGTCCHTACAAPNSCGTGTCLCNGVTCASGQACITWYLDQDGDKHAASSSNDKVGCDNQQPADVNGHQYYATADDCDDQDSRAHPGQTGWFAAKSVGGTWDYNCDGSTEHQYPSGIGAIGTTCKSCGNLCANGTTWGYSCSGSCAATIKTYKITSLPSVACGQGAPLYTCTSSGETQSSGDVTEGCR